MTVELTGITWKHARGLEPLVECSRLFEAESQIRVRWEVRPLQGFADVSVADLARRFDLVVFDHPHLGEAVSAGSLHQLDHWLGPEQLDDLRRNSVGPSYSSYEWQGSLWGSPIDAAGTVAAWRPDVVHSPPRTWDDLDDLASRLARRGQSIATPLMPIDVLTAFTTLIANAGVDPFAALDRVPRGPARGALSQLAHLVDLGHPMSLDATPIMVLDEMSSGDSVVYSPLVFGYSNYARDGYRRSLVRFGPFPSATGVAAGGVLGGAGLGVSAFSHHPEHAAAFVSYVSSHQIQSGPYVTAGGQPGHRLAWLDRRVNALAHGYFSNTLPVLDEQYLRPRYDGYLLVQSEGSRRLHGYLRHGGDADRALDDFDDIYKASRFRSAREVLREI